MTRCKSCNKQASFGKIGSKIVEYCALHKPIDYINVKDKT